jgi:hypothetical protein
MRFVMDLTPLLFEFAPAFRAVDSLKDPRLAILLSLFPERIFMHIEAFFASQTPTAYDAVFLSVVRAMDDSALAALIGRPGLLALATQSLGLSKVNGHIASFLRAVNERRQASALLQTVEWSDFVDGTLLPYLKQRERSYGGPYVQRHVNRVVTPSASTDLLDEAPEAESSSSGSASDDETAVVRREIAVEETPIARNERLRSHRSMPDVIAPVFDYLGDPQTSNGSEPINLSELPRLNASTEQRERHTRRRNTGSVSLADLPGSVRLTTG